MTKLGVLQDLNLGNSVAEFDTNLEDYFVATPALNEILKDSLGHYSWSKRFWKIRTSPRNA